jgi:hypothetical protein
MQHDSSSGQREARNSPSEGTRFRQSRLCCPEHPGVSDGSQSVADVALQSIARYHKCAMVYRFYSNVGGKWK